MAFVGRVGESEGRGGRGEEGGGGRGVLLCKWRVLPWLVSMPRIAIVGRPNVGKSSLLNMIAHRRVSIVDDMPGVTRDRVVAIVNLEPPEGVGDSLAVEFTDTGGFGVYIAEGARFDDAGEDLSTLTDDIEAQIAQAVLNADLVLFAVDTQAGITPRDLEIATMLREKKLGNSGVRAEDAQRDVPIRVVATKCDGPKWEPHGLEFASLGFGESLMCSAMNNYLRRSLFEELFTITSQIKTTISDRLDPTEMRLAIVGKRNAGKSTLVNTLAGEQRVIVSEIAGTTRDSIDVRFELDGKSMIAIDTAGLRRKRSFHGRVEQFAFERAKMSVVRANAVLLMIDATSTISRVDQKLGDLIRDSYKPVVIAINKWDVVEGTAGPNGKLITVEGYERYIRGHLKGLSFAPIAFLSASEGLNVRETINLAFEMFEQASTRVTTGKLNRFLNAILEKRGPTSKLGTRVKILYTAQTQTNPPTIVLVVNHPELFTEQYQRYLLNRFREELPFEEVPIRLIVKARSRKDQAQGKYDPSQATDQERSTQMPVSHDPADYFDE